jgi:hypothetical protein
MKNKINIYLVVFLNLLVCCKGANKEEQVAGIWITFTGIMDSDLSHAWIIETAKNDTLIHLDTIEYGQLTSIKAYTITLDFKTDRENGEYLIFADSIDGVNIISNVEVFSKDEHYEYSFMFNGVQKSSRNKDDLFLRITR